MSLFLGSSPDNLFLRLLFLCFLLFLNIVYVHSFDACFVNESEKLLLRWLMGLSLSKREQERVEELLAPNYKILPDSLIREENVNCDDIRSFIEWGYNAFNCKTEHHGVLEDLQIFNSDDVLRAVFFLLDDMTNKGLYSFVEKLTGGLVKYGKPNWCMKKIIGSFFPKLLVTRTFPKQI